MKYIFFFVILLSFSCKLPNTLDGKYYYSGGFVGESWLLKKDGSFTYNMYSCTGGYEGAGNYKIKDDSIHIIFAQYPGTSLQSSKIESIKTDSLSKSWELKFELSDRKDLSTLPFAVIITRDTSGNILKGTQTDLDGQAFINLPDYNATVFITIQYVGYEKINYELQNPGSYLVKGELADSFTKYIETNTRWDYRILNLSENKITWQTTYMDTIEYNQVKKYKSKTILKRSTL